MRKQAIAGFITTIAILASAPAKAQDFDTLLQSSLTPEEVAVHQQRGTAKAEQLARQTCTALRAGTSLRDFAAQVSQSLAKEGLTKDKLETTALYSGKVIAMGVAIFCPDYIPKLQELQP